MWEFSPIERVSGRLEAGLLILCDHASPALPPEYGDLGLPAEAFSRHIAYDIGAAGVARALARLLEAPAILSRFSRLLIDPNRGPDDPTLVMRLSDGAIAPGNADVDSAEIDRRLETYWRPYREAARETLEAMLRAGTIPAIVSIHSFTPCFKGRERPWPVGLLWDLDDRLARPLIEAFRADGLEVGDNQPYDGALAGDTMNELGTRRGLPHALIELRQDLVTDEKSQVEWAERIAKALRPILADPALRKIVFHGSRAL